MAVLKRCSVRFRSLFKLIGAVVFILTLNSILFLHRKTSANFQRHISNPSFLQRKPLRPSFPITLVTTYFRLEKAKNAASKYLTWHENFFPVIATPMVIYTTPSEFPRISALRRGKPTIFRLFPSVWDLPWIKEREPKNNSLPSFQKLYEKQHKIDPDYKGHSPALYAVWNSKAWMLQQTVHENPFSSTYFFYVDSGCVREPNRTAFMTNFPELGKVKEVFEDPENSWRRDRLHAFLVAGWPAWRSKREYRLREVPDVFAAGFFGGRREAVTKFSRKFYELHDRFLAEGRFVGKEQNLFDWLLFHHPDMFMVTAFLDVRRLVDFSNDDVYHHWNWMFFQQWYGADLDPRWKLAEVRNLTEFLKRHSP